MTSKKEIEAAETAIIALYITCDSYALEMAKAALEAAEKVRVDVATKREEKLIADNERYERKRYDASNVYAGLFRDFTTLTELLNKNIKREEKLREALEFYADSLYKEGLAYVKKEDRGIPINPCDPGTLYTPYKLSYDKGEIAKQALQQED